MLRKYRSNLRTAALKVWKHTVTTETLASIKFAGVLVTANTSTLNLNVGVTSAAAKNQPEVQLVKAAAANLVTAKAAVQKKAVENEKNILNHGNKIRLDKLFKFFFLCFESRLEGISKFKFFQAQCDDGFPFKR